MCAGNSSSPPSSASKRSALRESLASLRLPPGLLSAVYSAQSACDARVWIIDNSSFMKTRDSHLGHVDSESGTIERLDGISRWHELQEAVGFYSKLAAKCWMPTKFWLVNEPSGKAAQSAAASTDGGSGKKFALCWSTPADVPTELSNLSHAMKYDALEYSQCRLSTRLISLIKTISKEAPSLEANNKHIAVVICTQGTPTNSKGQSGRSIREEFRKDLRELTKLPTKVILRLTTDDEKVKEMYNFMDHSLDGVDVLDDYWGEAMEIHLHNPWLTYSPGLHRLREAGLAPAVFDDLDERPLTLDEIHQFCTLMFLGDDSDIKIPLPPYQPTTVDHTGRQSWLQAWTPFIRGLKLIVEKEKLQWNPMYKRMMPWINLAKLEMNLMEQLKEKDEAEARKYNYGRSSSTPYPNNNSSGPYNANGRRPKRQTHFNAKPNPSQKPDPTAWQSSRGVTSEMPVRPPPASTEKDLTKVLQKWSHQPPDYKASYSLQRLLITVPNTFPPMNAAVEPHEYFHKWKKLDRDAFDDIGRDEVKELLKRAVRKAKFFLHPDKLPKDLTENQTLLFKSVWDVITERETAILG